MARPIEYALIVGWKPIVAGSIGFGLGFKPTRSGTIAVSRWAIGNVLRPISVGVGIAAANVARAVALPLAVGYTLGAVGGTLISEAIFGESGKEDAIRLYTGEVSLSEYLDTLGEGLEVLIEDWF